MLKVELSFTFNFKHTQSLYIGNCESLKITSGNCTCYCELFHLEYLTLYNKGSNLHSAILPWSIQKIDQCYVTV